MTRPWTDHGDGDGHIRLWQYESNLPTDEMEFIYLLDNDGSMA